MIIFILYDFTLDTVKSYKEGLDILNLNSNHQFDFNTNCLDFFSTDCPADDVIILDFKGNTLSRNKLMQNDGTYINKEIRLAHNILKMFKAGSFNWQII